MHLIYGLDGARRRLVLALGAVLVLVVLLGFGVLRTDRADGASGTEAHLPTDPTGGTPEPTIDGSTTPHSSGPPSVRPAELPDTDDPQAYASAVASALFGMDQRTYEGGDYLTLLAGARVADASELIPEVTDEAFLAALAERIPDAYMWQRMHDSGQYAIFETTRVWEPDYIAEKRASGELPVGVVGLNVAGTQTIFYLDENGAPAQRERAQSLSLLLACEPVEPHCGLVAVSTGVVA